MTVLLWDVFGREHYRISAVHFQLPRDSSRWKTESSPCTVLVAHEGFRRLRLPGFSDSRRMKVVRLSHLCTGRLYPQPDSLALISVRGWMDPRNSECDTVGLDHSKNFNDLIGNRTRNLLCCCAVPQPTAPHLDQWHLWSIFVHVMPFMPRRRLLHRILIPVVQVQSLDRSCRVSLSFRLLNDAVSTWDA